ncbi:MAG TPA: hypothetical protein VGY55_11715 [Pirellulales bacterium]|jgi:hypothetical protein|nr:hypothetical protein [Pirellulales bacterium]
MARVGRPATAKPVREVVRRLAAAGASSRQIAAFLDGWSITISRQTAWQIVCEQDLELGPGEKRLRRPIRCSCGRRIVITPCRTCRLAAAHRTLDANRAMIDKAKQLRIGAQRLPRADRKHHAVQAIAKVDPLKLELLPDEVARLEEIKRAKIERGEG